MQALQRLGIAVGAPILVAGVVGGAVAFAASGGSASAPEAATTITFQEPEREAPPDKNGCPEKDGGSGASASEL